jgi:two-component system alkaline phosphatase synthesis response regulator PhoP
MVSVKNEPEIVKTLRNEEGIGLLKNKTTNSNEQSDRGEKMNKKKVMIVDDNPDIVYGVKKGLEIMIGGYEVISANSGKECFELLEKGNIPDIILLDIMMPEINGWDVFAKLKEESNWRKIPIIFLTAKADDYSVGFGKLTAEDYITKPFEIKELKIRIDKVLT